MNRSARLVAVCVVALVALAGLPPGTLASPPKTHTSVSITTTPNPAWVGELVTITVTVDPIPDGGFVTEGGPGYPVDPTTGQATFTRSYPSAGDWQVTAWFMGTDTFAASQPKTATTTVQRHPVVASMTLPTTTVLDLDGFDVSVALNEVPPSGTVIIQDMTHGNPGPSIGGASVTGTSPVVVHVGGLEAGTYQLRANYTGIDTYAAAVTASQSFAVAPAPPSSLYVDVDPQAGVYGPITLPLESDWHTRSTSATTIVAGHSIIAAGQPVGFTAEDQHWTIQFSKPGGALTAGSYDVPVPDQFQCPDICAIVRATSGGYCLGAGAFTIHDITFDADDILRSLNADFRLYCGLDLMSGSIRYHSAVDTVALDQDVDRMFFPDTDGGQSSPPQTVTITNFGTVATDLGNAALTGDAAGDYAISADSCSGAHLSVSASCTVSLRFVPVFAAHRSAQLEIPDGTSRGARQVGMIGTAFMPTTVALTAAAPTFGPAQGTFTYVVTPAGAGGPALFLDGTQQFGPSDVIGTDGTSTTWTYHVTVGPGHHEVTTRFDQNAYYRGTTVDPVEFDVGIGTRLDLTTSTDDGIGAGETATLVARLTAGAPLAAGTIRIRDAMTDAILATATATGTSSSVAVDVVASLGSHPYVAEFIPDSAGVQAATTPYDLVAVPGLRPTTTMSSTPLYSSTGEVLFDGYSSPDGGVTFECRVDVSNWFACPSPVVVHSNLADHVLSVRAVSTDGLGDRTPATRPWLIDQAPPAGTIQIADSSASTRTTSVTVSTAASDARSGVTQVALSNDGTNWVALPYAPSEAWTLSAGAGPRTVWAKWKDVVGNWSAPLSDTIVLDTVAPTTSGPVRTLVGGTALSSGRIPFRLSWTGSDSTSGIARYELSQSTDGGSYGVVPTTLASGGSDRLLAPGHTYRFRVRAVDNAGNVGSWAYGTAFTATGVSQASSAVHYHGTWATSMSSVWWGGTAKSSSSPGATVSYTFTGRSIAWVGLTASNRGKAYVYINGVLKATVDLYSATTLKQRIVWSANYSTSATRTITIKVLGTASRPRVDVDGFVVGS